MRVSLLARSRACSAAGLAAFALACPACSSSSSGLSPSLPDPGGAGSAGAGGQDGAGGSGKAGSGAGVGNAGDGGAGGAAGTGGSAGSFATGTYCALPSAPTALAVPPGFCIHPYVSAGLVTEPRIIRFAPNGDLFLVSPGQYTAGGANGGAGAILVLPDDNHDGVADAALPFAGGGSLSGLSCAEHEKDPADLFCAHGLAFADGYIYYTRSNEVRRFPYAPGDRKAPQPAGELVSPALGNDTTPGARFTHGLDVAPDGSLVVSRGRGDSASCSPGEMQWGSVFTVPVQNGAALPVPATILADGFRNPMYLRCFSGQCFADELSGDGWDGIGGHEKVAMLGAGQHWGFPCCVDKGMPTNGASAEVCAGVTASTVTIPLHDTPFGLDLERGHWPAPFGKAVYFALHGRFTSGVGSRVAYLSTDASGHPTGVSTDFVTGWSGVGKATDVAFAPDGRLFVIDDASGGIWWIAPADLAVP